MLLAPWRQAGSRPVPVSLQRPSSRGASGTVGAAGHRPQATRRPLARAGSRVPLDLGVSVSPGSLPLPLPPEALEPRGPRVPMPRDRLPVTDRTFLLLLSSQLATFAKKKGLSPTESCPPMGCACHPSIALVPLTAKARTRVTGRAVGQQESDRAVTPGAVTLGAVQTCRGLRSFQQHPSLWGSWPTGPWLHGEVRF